MERLTMTSDKGGLAFTFDLDITCKPVEMRKILVLGERLKAYEDTGLEPQKIWDNMIELGQYRLLGTVEDFQRLKSAAENMVFAWDNCYIEPYTADVKDYIEQMRQTSKGGTA